MSSSYYSHKKRTQCKGSGVKEFAKFRDDLPYETYEDKQAVKELYNELTAAEKREFGPKGEHGDKSKARVRKPSIDYPESIHRANDQLAYIRENIEKLNKNFKLTDKDVKELISENIKHMRLLRDAYILRNKLSKTHRY